MTLSELKHVAEVACTPGGKVVGAFGFKPIGEPGHREQLIDEATYDFLCEFSPARILRMIEVIERAEVLREYWHQFEVMWSRADKQALDAFDKALEELGK